MSEESSQEVLAAIHTAMDLNKNKKEQRLRYIKKRIEGLYFLELSLGERLIIKRYYDLVVRNMRDDVENVFHVLNPTKETLYLFMKTFYDCNNSAVVTVGRPKSAEIKRVLALRQE